MTNQNDKNGNGMDLDQVQGADSMANGTIEDTLRRRVIMVNVSMSNWTGRKKDRAVSQTAASAYGVADSDVDTVGHYMKRAVSDDTLREINTTIGKFRNHVIYAMTAPSGIEGWRLLPVTLYNDFFARVRQIEAELFELTRDFFEKYDRGDIQRAESARLNGMYNPADYPAPDVIRAKFKMDVRVMPVPTSGVLVAEIADEARAEVNKQLADAARGYLTSMEADAWNKIYKVLAALRDKMTESPRKTKHGIAAPIFRDSIIQNVRDVIDIGRRANITNNSVLSAAFENLSRNIANIDPQSLREDASHRKETARKADTVIKKLTGVFGPAQTVTDQDKAPVKEEKAHSRLTMFG